MAPPPREQEPSVGNSPEYTQFIAKLEAYHEKRGTHFDPEPKVGNRHVDLLQLFKTVVERGGYDAVSDEKKLWRKLGQDFNLGTTNMPASIGFSLKTTYYKYLAAYEISTIHKKEPPPKEILEDTTAKGSGLLRRTVENYKPSSRTESGLGNAQSDGSGDDGTPVRDRNASEDAPGSGGRVTRGLRQAPPQRVLFQPDTNPARRNPPQHQNSTSAPSQGSQTPAQQAPPRGASASYNPSNMENMSVAVANYEPRQQMPIPLRQVITPSSNPAEFARRQQLLKQHAAGQSVGQSSSGRGMFLPGHGFDGPNIYVRCQLALRSGVKSEVDYALHHLVKISMERGDKYKFVSFSGLAEALIDKVLDVSSLFYKVDWEISYEDNTPGNQEVIDGLNGTPDILNRIAKLKKLPLSDTIHDVDFGDRLLHVNEAALTLRNMVMLEENAEYVSELRPLRDFLSIALNLPNLASVVELKHYALDIAEQLTKYLFLDANDPLYVSLLDQLQSQDRGAILTSLRAISRISMNLEENNSLKGVPVTAVQNIMDWTLLNDEDLVHACLDFLYQYTAVVDNVDFMITELQVEALINQLTRLLSYGAKITQKELSLTRDNKRPAPSDPAPVPKDLLAQLLRLEEPDRSSQWLRCLCEEDKDESITQIALWQAYQQRFTIPVAEQGRAALLPAAEFIKGVSLTFAEKAVAQVQTGVVQKFIIKGIRFRDVPVDFKGDEYSRCQWRSHPTGVTQCGEFFMTAENMYNHILKDHFQAPQLENGMFQDHIQDYLCLWGSCQKHPLGAPASRLSQIASHIKVHLPQSSPSDGAPPAKRLKPSYIIPGVKQLFTFMNTPTDERGDAAGIPLSAVLVLRNLARNLPKTEAEEVALKTGEKVSWVDRLFKPVEKQLFEVFAHNKTLSIYMADLIAAIREA
ncbi:Chromatin structure-remodeling complex subunit rsc9 [Phlyctema vagabunda]|uniref:Chromatin structure-remodeling complex subunit rsc9 n=1 Tax=Phlyctema vagabunda TaxID=108571 RepID=A0ABR4PEN8_9HELO